MIVQLTDQSVLRTVNRGLFIAYVNADPITRASLDIRTATCLYDASGMFETCFAPDAELSAEQWDRLEQAGARYWSRGFDPPGSALTAEPP